MAKLWLADTTSSSPLLLLLLFFLYFVSHLLFSGFVSLFVASCAPLFCASASSVLSPALGVYLFCSVFLRFSSLFFSVSFLVSPWWFGVCSWRWIIRLTNACSFSALHLRFESKGKSGMLSFCSLPVSLFLVPSLFSFVLSVFFFRVLPLSPPTFLRPFSSFYKAREGLLSRPPEMAGIVEARDRGFRNGIMGIVAVICWIFPVEPASSARIEGDNEQCFQTAQLCPWAWLFFTLVPKQFKLNNWDLNQ